MLEKTPLLAALVLLAACGGADRPAQLPQQEGDILRYRYHCAQGQVDVEYARMGGQDSATLQYVGGKDETLRKVLPRADANRFALDALSWTGDANGQYTLSDGGETLLQQCSGRPHNVFRDKDDHQGTVQLDLGRILN